jgi:hypothetical protein
MSLVHGWDAATCPDPAPKQISGNSIEYAGGYLGGSSAFRTWAVGEWQRASDAYGRVLPIWVPTPGSDNPRQVGLAAIDALRAAGVPNHATPWRVLMWDLETGVEPSPAWLTTAADTLANAGYGSLIYGSPGGSHVLSYPRRTGYVVADWNGRPTLYPAAGVVGTQYAANVTVPGGVVDLDVMEETMLAHLGRVH